MNPAGINPNAANNMAAINQQRELNKNIAAAQVTNATTIGKTVNKTDAEVKNNATLQPPQERVTLSTSNPATEQKTTSGTDAAGQGQASTTSGAQETQQSAETAQKPASKSAEALSNFTNAFGDLRAGDEKEFKGVVDQWLNIPPENLPPGESGKEVALAATALKTAVKKLQEKMPNATPEQIREAAKKDPEIARWANIADTAGNFLNEIKAEGAAGAGPSNPSGPQPDAAAGGPPGPPNDNNNPPGPADQFRLNPEQQAQMMADNVKTMQAIMNIYQQMWAEIAKARAQRHQLMMETANAINAMMMESHVNRMKTSENHRKAIMSVILETAK